MHIHNWIFTLTLQTIELYSLCNLIRDLGNVQRQSFLVIVTPRAGFLPQFPNGFHILPHSYLATTSFSLFYIVLLFSESCIIGNMKSVEPYISFTSSRFPLHYYDWVPNQYPLLVL